MRNSDLLLIHGTVYGTLHEDTSGIDFVGISSSIDLHGGSIVGWQEDVFGIGGFLQPLAVGEKTDNTPIDVVHWGISGVAPQDSRAWWGRCLKVLTHL